MEELEQIMRRIHVLFAKCEPYGNEGEGKIIVPKKELFRLLEKLSYAVIRMMDEYEGTAESRERGMTAYQREGERIKAAAQAGADDVYAASLIYTDNMLEELHDLVADAKEELWEQYARMAGRLDSHARLLSEDQEEIKQLLTAMAQGGKYLKIIEHENKRLQKMEAARARSGEAEYGEEDEPYEEDEPFGEDEVGTGFLPEADAGSIVALEPDAAQEAVDNGVRVEAVREVGGMDADEESQEPGSGKKEAAENQGAEDAAFAANGGNIGGGNASASGVKTGEQGGGNMPASSVKTGEQGGENMSASGVKTGKQGGGNASASGVKTGKQGGGNMLVSGKNPQKTAGKQNSRYAYKHKRPASQHARMVPDLEAEWAKEEQRPVRKIGTAIYEDVGQPYEEPVKRVSYEIKVNQAYFDQLGEGNVDLDAEYYQWKEEQEQAAAALEGGEGTSDEAAVKAAPDADDTKEKAKKAKQNKKEKKKRGLKFGKRT